MKISFDRPVITGKRSMFNSLNYFGWTVITVSRFRIFLLGIKCYTFSIKELFHHCSWVPLVFYFFQTCNYNLHVLLEYPKPLCFCICYQIPKMLVILLLSISTFCVSTSILLKDFHFVCQWLADSIINLYKWSCQTCWRYKD